MAGLTCTALSFEALPLATDLDDRIAATSRLSQNPHQGVRPENGASHRECEPQKPANAPGKSPAVRWNRGGACCSGRENDGAGLYSYRARYYSPTFQRFIAQDPIGFAGGDPNMYRYVYDNPVNGRDPSGRGLIGGGIGLIIGGLEGYEAA